MSFIDQRKWWEKLVQSPHFWSIAKPILGILAGVSGTFVLLHPKYRVEGILVATVLGMLSYLPDIWSNFSKLKNELRNDSLPQMELALSVLHQALASFSPNSDPRDLGIRLCLYVVNRRDSTKIIRATNYVGERKRTGLNKEIPIHCGIVGMALRKNAAAFDWLRDDQELVAYSIATYGFTPEEAANLRKDRRAWGAVPIIVNGAAIAAIYLDSSDPGFWGKSNNPKRKIVKHAAIAIAETIPGDVEF